MNFKEEENSWYSKFLEIYYFKEWRENFLQYNLDKEYHLSGLEFNIRGYCNLSCKYCYMNNFREDLYPSKIDNIEDSLSNVESILNWLLENQYLPDHFEIFGGEAISLDNYKKLFDLLLNFIKQIGFPNRKKNFNISFPLNVIFLKDKEYFDYFIFIQKEFLKYNVIIHFSISLDGKFADPLSRPAKDKNFKYDDEFYAIIADFCNQVPVKPGFHPMVAAENIAVWKENIDWYFEYLKNLYGEKDFKDSLYLLEVRNDNWTPQNLKDLDSFIDHFFEKLIQENLVNDVLFNLTFNFFSQLASYVSRGYGCSIQQTLSIRTGDMAIIPCHRLAYPQFVAANFVKDENNKIIAIKTKMPYLHFAINNDNTKNHLPCINCEIVNICNGPCGGSNFETTGDPFSVSPSVCRMEKAKVKSIIKNLIKYNFYDMFIDKMQEYSLSNNDYGAFTKKKLIEIINIKDEIVKENNNE